MLARGFLATFDRDIQAIANCRCLCDVVFERKLNRSWFLLARMVVDVALGSGFHRSEEPLAECFLETTGFNNSSVL